MNTQQIANNRSREAFDRLVARVTPNVELSPTEPVQSESSPRGWAIIQPTSGNKRRGKIKRFLPDNRATVASLSGSTHSGEVLRIYAERPASWPTSYKSRTATKPLRTKTSSAKTAPVKNDRFVEQGRRGGLVSQANRRARLEEQLRGVTLSKAEYPEIAGLVLRETNVQSAARLLRESGFAAEADRVVERFNESSTVGLEGEVYRLLHSNSVRFSD